MKITKILYILLALLILSGCNKETAVKKYAKQLETSMETVIEIRTEIQMLDSEVVIYKNIKKGRVNEDKYNVNVEIFALDESFTLNRQSTTDTVEDLDRSLLLQINLKEEYLENIVIENDVLENLINNKNIKKLYVTNDLSIDGNAELKLT